MKDLRFDALLRPTIVLHAATEDSGDSELRVLHALLLFIRAFVRDRPELAMEKLAPRQQVAALRQKSKRRRYRNRGRIFWMTLSRIWAFWRSV